MNKINNKGFTIIEIILSFSFIMIISTGLFVSATNYKNKQNEEAILRDLESYKADIISAIHNEVDKRGLVEVSKSGNSIKIIFEDGYWLDIRGNLARIVMLLKHEVDGATVTDKTLNYTLKDSNSAGFRVAEGTSGAMDIGFSQSLGLGMKSNLLANIYKITFYIEIKNYMKYRKISEFPIDIVLTSFSRTTS